MLRRDVFDLSAAVVSAALLPPRANGESFTGTRITNPTNGMLVIAVSPSPQA